MQVVLFPHASVAPYVLSSTKLHGIPTVTSDICSMVTPPLQLSETVTNAISGGGIEEEHDKVISDGHVMEGATSSITVIVCAHVVELPQTSVATYAGDYRHSHNSG